MRRAKDLYQFFFTLVRKVTSQLERSQSVCINPTVSLRNWLPPTYGRVPPPLTLGSLLQMFYAIMNQKTLENTKMEMAEFLNNRVSDHIREKNNGVCIGT